MADVDVQKLPQEISNKYVLENNTLSKPVVIDVEKTIDIEIGDSKQPDFKPQVKTLFFDNEYNVSVRAEEKPNATIELEGEKVKYITDEYEVHLYDKPDAGENGGHEIEWLLPQKPKSNVLKATLVYKGNVKFYYQGELTQEEIDDGCIRPENVIGSYAVYIDRENYNLGNKNYATGKIEHIYRPQAIDAKGNKTWCDIYIPESGQADTPINITVTIPQKFLDEAVYPVIVDPTFGYTTAGGSQQSSNATTSRASKFTGALGTVTSISVYGHAISWWRFGINKVSDLTNVLKSSNESYTDENAWRTLSASGDISAIDYILGVGGNNGFYICYDSGDTNQGYYSSSGYEVYNGLTFTVASNDNHKYSIYATYTEGATSSIKKIMGVAIASVKKVSSLAIASVKKVIGVANG